MKRTYLLGSLFITLFMALFITGISLNLSSCGSIVSSSSSAASAGSGAPVIQITSPANNSTNNSNVIALTGTATDPDGVAGVYLIIGSGTQTRIGADTFNTNLNLTNGSYILKISAMDNIGNVSSIIELNVTVNTNLAGPDVYPPVVNVASIQNSMTNTTGILSVSGTASDQSGVEGVYLAVNTSAFSKIGTTNFMTNLSLSNGIYTLKIYGKDISNNISATNIYSNIVVNTNIVDTNAPAAAILYPSADGASIITADVNILGSINDQSPSSGISNLFVSMNGISFTSIAFSGTNWNYQLNALTNGNYRVWAYGIDNAGNVGVTNTRTFTVDVPNIGLNTGFEYWSAGLPSGWTNGYEGSSSETNFDSIVQSSTAYAGNYSLQVQWTGNGVNKYPVIWNTNYLPVTAGNTYVAAFYAKSVAGSPQAAPEIKFYDNNNAYLSVVYGTFLALSSSSWGKVLTVGTAPANAAFARIFVEGHKVNDGTFLADSVIFTNIGDYDTTPPSINSVTAPANYYTNALNSVFNVSGTASDDTALKTIYAAMGGVTNSTSSSLSSWTIPFNTAGLAAGDYNLSIWAKDYAGYISAVSNISVSLTNSGAMPVSLLAGFYFETGNPNFNSPSTNDPGLMVSDWTNNGIGVLTFPAGCGSAKGCSSTNWSTNSIPQYFTVTLTPSGKTVNLTQLWFEAYRSGTGPANFMIRSSADSYASDLGTGTLTTASTWTTNVINLSGIPALSNLTSPITLRIYGTNATGGAGTFRVDDVTISGNIY